MTTRAQSGRAFCSTIRGGLACYIVRVRERRVKGINRERGSRVRERYSKLEGGREGVLIAMEIDDR